MLTGSTSKLFFRRSLKQFPISLSLSYFFLMTESDFVINDSYETWFEFKKWDGYNCEPIFSSSLFLGSLITCLKIYIFRDMIHPFSRARPSVYHHPTIKFPLSSANHFDPYILLLKPHYSTNMIYVFAFSEDKKNRFISWSET
ncbi:MAG: hypothetical protein Ct9H90mP13_12320 [Pseudomonadota bacterium]|nr:MAG: hypothetical protein Ct9H90mP13_12320 [Pseudomonadota bacterium]